jgi:hypothetical protein
MGVIIVFTSTLILYAAHVGQFSDYMQINMKVVYKYPDINIKLQGIIRNF